MLKINVVTLFPEVFEPFFGASIPGRAAGWIWSMSRER